MKTLKRLHVDPAMLFFILLAILLGGYMRISQVVGLSFPVNDGGMFYRMTTDLIANGYRLPAVTSYNAANIAYAYPPLAFYLAGFLTSIFHWPLIDIFRLLPAILATLTIPAFALLAGNLLKSKAQTALAVLVFALMPSSFSWLIMGGGISRSLGLLFSLLTLWAAYRLYTRHGIVNIVTTAIFGALAILSHPESGIHTAAGALLFFLFIGRNKRGLIRSLIVAVGVILLTAPWWVTVISHNGLSPILAATRTGGYHLDIISTFVQLNNGEEIFLTFMGCFSVIGIFISLAKRQVFLPLWVLIIILSEPRSAPLYLTPVLALFVGITLEELMLPGLIGIEANHTTKSPQLRNNWAEVMLSGTINKVFLAYLFIYFIMSAFAVPYNESRALIVKPDDLTAFEWIKNNIPGGNVFIVMTGNQPLTDPTAEWFPALTNQVSVATVQGAEWDAGRDFNMVLSDSSDLQKCILQDAQCIASWKKRTDKSFSYIYFSKVSIENLLGGVHITIPLEQSLLASGDYAVLYETGNVAILKVIK